ncbi:MAG: sulfite exporter TauE/SafE family protein [Anaerolineales bacterium]|nr:sulfite exporter TauE/SafE family protein [Anaerolineales bacterium]
MDTPWALYALVVGAGFLCGVINTLAGSGSLISLPVLIFLGLPAPVANGTNRIGILLQNLAAGWSFQHSRVLDLRGALLLSIPAVLGSILGASIAVNLDEEMMELVIGAVMVLMLFVLLLRPQRWLQGSMQSLDGGFSWPQAASLFAIGVYGGFIQAGVGIFLLAALVLSVGYDLVRANAVKIIVVLAFTISSLLIFANNNQVDWGAGLLLGLGNMAGGWAAARLAVTKGAAWVRWVLIIVVAFSALYLFGAFEFIGRLLGLGG